MPKKRKTARRRRHYFPHWLGIAGALLSLVVLEHSLSLSSSASLGSPSPTTMRAAIVSGNYLVCCNPRSTEKCSLPQREGECREGEYLAATHASSQDEALQTCAARCGDIYWCVVGMALAPGEGGAEDRMYPAKMCVNGAVREGGIRMAYLEGMQEPVEVWSTQYPPFKPPRSADVASPVGMEDVGHRLPLMIDDVENAKGLTARRCMDQCFRPLP